MLVGRPSRPSCVLPDGRDARPTAASNPSLALGALKPRRRAFTLLELLIAVTILAILSAMAVSGLTPNDGARLSGAAALIASDLEFAQSLSIANPDDLAAVRFNPDAVGGATYWVALASDPSTPIDRPETEEPYLVQFGQGDAAQLTGVNLALTGATDQTLVFDQFGRLTTTDEVTLTLSNAAGTREVRVSASTGFVTVQ